MRFDPSDIHAAELDPDRVTTWHAWHTFHVDCGERGVGRVLVLDAAIRYAHLLLRPEQLRHEIADRLNALADAEGYEAVVARLQALETPLELDNLWK
jgi:hypothetical protein